MSFYKYIVDLKEIEDKDFAFEVGGFYLGEFGDQIDTIEAVYVKDGKLIIEGRKEK